MKKLNKKLYTLLALLIIIVTSCDNNLDIGPEDSLTSDIVLSNAGLAEGVLIGAYARMRDDDAFNGTTQLTQEWMSDNVNFVGSFPTFQDIRDYSTLADNTSIAAYWRDSYDVISPANFLINNLPVTEILDLPDADKAKFIAEAKFIRAITYFNLVNLFAQPFQISGGTNDGVPIITEFFEGDASIFQKPRNTVNEVHAFIETNLLEAIPNLDAVGSRGRATKGAARALLARLYLYREEFRKAAEFADLVIKDPNFTLATDYSFFNQDDNSEHIFQIINNAIDGQTSGQGFSGLSTAAPTGRGDAPFSQDLINAFEAGDLRFTTLSTQGVDAVGGVSTFSTKFPEAVNNSDNAPLLRITEMYTIRAEANLRDPGADIGDSPLNDINKLRLRANVPALATVDLNIILNEKRKELCFEGQRRMDLLRNGLSLRRTGQANVTESAPGANKTILPIPTAERDLNPNISQNQGY